MKRRQLFPVSLHVGWNDEITARPLLDPIRRAMPGEVLEVRDDVLVVLAKEDHDPVVMVLISSGNAQENVARCHEAPLTRKQRITGLGIG